ncbi:hypothetical protein [Bacillus sp. THAF10]|uniref:hypothetical protein n=1 Tax=Bacillus sp. THAF10 TaxID=2587848 RepID=UPI001268AC9A|nr:hypothetical protein [Bacillus sp. THAF10]
MKALKIWKSFLILFFVMFILTPTEANAAAKLEVKVEYGVDNKVQMGKGHPVRLEVVNKGEAVKGDFVIFSNPNYNMAGSYIVPFEIEAGGTKSIELSVKGNTDHHSYGGTGTNDNYISFFEGGVEKGKEVKLSGNVKTKPRYLGDNRVVMGVLSNNHDAVNYMKLFKYQMESMEILNITSANVPSNAVGLEMFDVLLVHDFPISTLKNEQQKAIKDWVNSGGSIIFDTKVGIKEDLGDINEFLLLDPKEETTIQKINEDSTFPNFPVFTGNLLYEDITVVTKDDKTPFTIVRKVGAGAVAQVTSNFAAPQWADWKEVNLWWNSVLPKLTSKSPSHYKQPLLEELSYQLSSIGEAFPGSIVSVPLLISSFIIYLILLIPVLYIVLRKLDKREQAWWIIPAIAVFTSVAVFGIGAKDRIAGTQINEASVLLLDNQSGLGSGFGVSTILTNSGGDYQVSTDAHTSYFPVASSVHSGSFEMIKHAAYINPISERTDITFNNVEYWSTRTSIGTISNKPVGKIDYDISFKDSTVQGSITNQLNFELTDAYILSGNNAHKLGNIKAGESVEVKYEVAKGNIANALTVPQNSAANKAFPGFSSNYHHGPSANNIEKEELETYKRFQMLDFMLYRKELLSMPDQPLLVGYVTSDLVGTEVKGKSNTPNATHLVVLPVDIIHSGGGSFSFTEKQMQPTLAVAENASGMIHHNGLAFGENYVYLGNGTYTLSYQLPDLVDKKKDEITDMKLKLRVRELDIEYAIYNFAKDELEILENKSSITLENNLKDYLSDEGVIQLSLKVNSMDSDIEIPGIQVKGEIKE